MGGKKGKDKKGKEKGEKGEKGEGKGKRKGKRDKDGDKGDGKGKGKRKGKKGKGKRKGTVPDELADLPEGPKVEVGNLPPSTTEENLSLYFGACGEVLGAKLLKKKEGEEGAGEFSGKAVVVFADYDAQEAAVAGFDDTEFEGVEIKVKDLMLGGKVLDFSMLAGEGDMSFLDDE